ncbi:MAG: choice-of-anchor Q domain-containing protein [Chloroflexota bacterium]
MPQRHVPSPVSLTMRLYVIAFISLCLLSLLIFPQILTAQGNEITDITPNQAIQGQEDVSVDITFDNMAAPPGDLFTSIKIGTTEAKTHTYASPVLTAIFDIPENEVIGLITVSVTFTTPGGDLTFTETDGFEILTKPCEITVTNNNDAGDGSLRQALEDICDGGVINFDNDYTVTLSNTLHISQNMTIDGTGHNITFSGNDSVRVLHIIDSSSVVTLTQLNIIDGRAVDGGGIYNQGTLTVKDSVLMNNQATDDGGALFNKNGTVLITNSQILTNAANDAGAGILNDTETGLMTIVDSTIAGNRAGIFTLRGAQLRDVGDCGGGIKNYYSDMVIINSTIRDNELLGTGGGGICNTGETSHLYIEDSLIYQNIANGGQGGGIYTTQGSLITNTTISKNAADVGGGIYGHLSSGDLSMLHTTIVSNTGNLNGDNIGMSGDRSLLQLGNSIVAGSNDNCYTTNDGGIIDDGYNLDSGTTCPFTLTTSLTNTAITLLTLADNGGQTETHALPEDSPAMDHIPFGSNGCGTSITDDQRGEVRPANIRCDIGAYEYQVTPTCFTTYGAFTTTQFSSQDALAVQAAIDAASSGDTVKIAGLCAGVLQTNNLSQTVYISKTITLQGGYTNTNWIATSDPDMHVTTLDAENNGRVVYVDNTSQLTLDGLLITHGRSDDDGGGIYLNNGTVLTLTHSSLISNTTGDDGGGIFGLGGRLTIQNSTLSENVSTKSSGYGGSIAYYQGPLFISNTLISESKAGYGAGINAGSSDTTVDIINSTIQNNLASDKGGGGVTIIDAIATISGTTIDNNTITNGGGGGIHLDFDVELTIINSTVSNNTGVIGGGIDGTDPRNIVTLTHVTVSSNTASLSSDGIRLNNGQIAIINSIIANNGSSDCTMSNTTFMDGGYNITSDATCPLTMTTSFTNTDPLLAPLTDNGGQTETHALLEGSPAIDNIPSGENGCSTDNIVDQRGITRPIETNCDSGAYEYDGPRYILSVQQGGTGSGIVNSLDGGIGCGVACSKNYVATTIITLTATADFGSTFTGWSGSCTGMGDCQLALNQAESVTATFTLNTYPLTVTNTGTGGGAVTSDPAAIDCGSTCSDSFDHGTVVTLTATADVGSTFSGWSGDCTGTIDCQITLDQAKSVTATFTLNIYDLTVTKSGSGDGTVASSPSGIDCGTDCSETLDHGSVMTLTATAESGSVFIGWEGLCSGIGSCQVMMDQAQQVTATFSLAINTITAAKDGNGNGTILSDPDGINCGSDCSESYDLNTVITLTAIAESDSVFIGWQGDCTGTDVCQITMNDTRQVTATFQLISYTLTVNKTGEGNGTVSSVPDGIDCGSDCSASFDYNSVVTLTTAADTGSSFTGWLGACSGTAACQVTLDQAQAVTATFALQSLTLTVTIAGDGGGTVSSDPIGIDCGNTCEQTFTYNSVVTLTATPDASSIFSTWGGGCSGTGLCLITMTESYTLTATFTNADVNLDNFVYLPAVLR